MEEENGKKVEQIGFEQIYKKCKDMFFKYWKVLVISLPLSLILFLVFHNLFSLYSRLIDFMQGTTQGSNALPSYNIGILGDSLAALSFLALIYSLFQTTKALMNQSYELRQNRKEMKLNRKEAEEANRLRIQTEINNNVRELIENLKVSQKGKKESWEVETRNIIIKANISVFIEYAGNVLCELLRSKSQIIIEFVKLLIAENVGRINLSKTILINVDLSEVELRGANLSRANLSRANLCKADLTKADLCGANLSEADLSRAKLIKADLSGAELFGARLIGTKLNETHLGGAHLSKAKLTRADLNGANISGVDLSRASLFGAKLSKAKLNEADLSRANLSKADLREADLREADLSEAKLSETDLSNARLSGANLTGTNLYRAILPSADLSGVNLSGAILKEADLSGADLNGANLYKADLSGADLSFAILSRVNLREAVGLKINQLLTAFTLLGVKEENLDQILWNEIHNKKPGLLKASKNKYPIEIITSIIPFILLG